MRQLRSPILFLPLLALPLLAREEALHGTWDSTMHDEQIGEIFTSLTFEADGAFEIDQVIQVKEDFLGGLGIPETIAIDSITARGTGTYGVEGDSIRVDIARWDLRVDGEDFDDFFPRVAPDLARHFAGLNGIPEERYPEYEQVFVDEFLAAIDEIDFLSGFEEGASSAYVVEGNVLVLTSTGETDRLRIPPRGGRHSHVGGPDYLGRPESCRASLKSPGPCPRPLETSSPGTSSCCCAPDNHRRWI